MYKQMAFTNINKTLVREMSSTSSDIPVLPNVITRLTKEDFFEHLKTNRTAFIIKFGAEWCAPCKKIDPLVYEWMSKMPEEIKCAIIDIDDNFELYAFLKSKKMANSIPTILCYYFGNEGWVADDFVIGANETEVKLFFQRCIELVK